MWQGGPKPLRGHRPRSQALQAFTANDLAYDLTAYIERLKVLNLPTLKYRRYRGDMIELFKILKGIYDTSYVPQFDLVQLSEDNIRTRGNNYKLIQHTVIMI